MNDSSKSNLEDVQVLVFDIEPEKNQLKETEVPAETASNNYHQFFSIDD